MSRVTLRDKVDPYAWSDARQREAASAMASPRYLGEKAPRLKPTERAAATTAAVAFLSPDADDGIPGTSPVEKALGSGSMGAAHSAAQPSWHARGGPKLASGILLGGAENCRGDTLEAKAWTELAPHRQTAYRSGSQTLKLSLLSPAECDAMPRPSRSHGAACPGESELRNRARSAAR